MKKSIVTLLGLLCVMVADAQNEVGSWSVIPRVGVNLSNLSNDCYAIGSEETPGTQKSQYKAGMKAGVEVEYQATATTALSAGLFYSMQGSRCPDMLKSYKGMDANEPVTNYTAISDFTNDLQYLAVPIMLRRYIFKGFSVGVGVQLGYLLKAKTHLCSQQYVEYTDGAHKYEPINTYDNDVTSSTKRFDFSAPIIGISYEYENVILDARYALGLTNTSKIDVVNTKNRNFDVTIGYRFSL